MKIGKRTILINPDLRKLLCVVGIVGGYIMWPKESDYQRYEQRQETDEG